MSINFIRCAALILFACGIISGLESARHDIISSNLKYRKANFRTLSTSNTELKLVNFDISTKNAHYSDTKLNNHAFLLSLRGGNKVENGLVPQKIGDVVAKLLGYVMGLGAVAVYLPIVIKLLKSKDAKGMSLQTWICNLLGLSMAVLYPFKKGFPISTYIELVTIAIQSVFILFLVCLYNNQVTQFLIGIFLFSATAAAVSIAEIPANILNLIQLLSILICNYANIPQILLTFRLRKASWSGITAAMSVGGCLIRMFTTMQLTKDLLVFGGYSLGFVTNLILLLQVIYFKDGPKK